MLKFKILTLFPEFYDSFLNTSLIKKAREQGILKFEIHNLRNFSIDSSIDDYPYGGGSGMVLKPEPVFNAYENLKEKDDFFIIFSPRGRLLNYKLAKEIYEKSKNFLLLCPRYEGVDERAIIGLNGFELSIGDYILLSGDCACLVFIEVISRFERGVVGKESSVIDDSFSKGLLEYPQYTRPKEFKGMKVPDVLLSGDHKKIEEWRREMAYKITKERRPDLLEGK